MLRTIAAGIATLVLVLAALAFVFQAQIGDRLFTRAVEQNAARNATEGLADGLHVGLCGTGSPMPNIQRAGPCNIVIAGNQMFVVDIGEGGNRNIALMGFDVSALNAVFLTHYHSDHIDGLGPLQLYHWTRGASESPLPIYGPAGLETVIEGFNTAYRLDDGYRTAHHGEAIAPSSGGGSIAHRFDLEAPSQIIYERDGLQVIAFSVDHSPVEPAVGYRFNYRNRSLCISGDTVRSANLETVCQGVDILIHEALQPALLSQIENVLREQGNDNAATIMFDIADYHSTPRDAADSAAAANAGMLVLTHLVPPIPSALIYPAFLGDASDGFSGPIIMGEDGMFFSLPTDSDEIRRETLF